MTRLLSFNPEPFESESEVNGALQAQWLATGPASGAGHQPKPELEISPTVPARPRTRRRPTGSVSPTRPSSTGFDGEAFRKGAIQIAKQELPRWGNGRIKETDPRVRKTLQDYWKTGTGASFSEDQLGNPAFQNANPWSAAFISWL